MMQKLRSLMQNRASARQRQDLDHPLAHVALRIIEMQGIVDVTDLARALGAPSSPQRAVRAYRIVAADILGALDTLGRIKRHGTVPPRPEDGGHWYTVPGGGAG